VLLPFHRTAQFIKSAAQRRFHLNEKTLVRQSAQHNYFRSILFFSKESTGLKESEIMIQAEPGKYTREFVELLRDYYLHL
jgi:tRNA1(Val) A37 N6-methylase TrmN6